MALRIVTANVDFALRPKMVKEDLKFLIERADVICFQEAKRVDIDQLITDPEWAVFQPSKDDATKGSGIAWRTSVVKRKAYGKSVGTKSWGRAILTRYITWVRLDYDGQEIVVASLHMPPKRFWGWLYNNMLKNVERFMKRFRVPLILGADWNKLVMRAPDLRRVAGQRQGKFYGHGIDGFLVVGKGKLRVTSSKKLRDTHSDHDPFQIKVELDRP